MQITTVKYLTVTVMQQFCDTFYDSLYKECLYIHLKSNDKYWLLSNGEFFKTLGVLHCAVKELFVVSVDCSKYCGMIED
jgi:hypothetical protein